jgi:hypothetical protein
MIEAAAPKNEIEGALAVQMACTHTAAMAVLAKLERALQAYLGHPEYDAVYGARARSVQRLLAGLTPGASVCCLLTKPPGFGTGVTARTVRPWPLSCERTRKTRIFTPIWDSSGESLVETTIASTQ